MESKSEIEELPEAGNSWRTSETSTPQSNQESATKTKEEVSSTSSLPKPPQNPEAEMKPPRVIQEEEKKSEGLFRSAACIEARNSKPTH